MMCCVFPKGGGGHQKRNSEVREKIERLYNLSFMSPEISKKWDGDSPSPCDP